MQAQKARIVCTQLPEALSHDPASPAAAVEESRGRPPRDPERLQGCGLGREAAPRGDQTPRWPGRGHRFVSRA